MPYTQHGLPFVSGSATSREAALAQERKWSANHDKVRDAIIAAGPLGLCDDEIELATGLIHQTASSRRRQLEQAGVIVRTTMRRKTRSGCSAFAYVALRYKGET